MLERLFWAHGILPAGEQKSTQILVRCVGARNRDQAHSGTCARCGAKNYLELFLNKNKMNRFGFVSFRFLAATATFVALCMQMFLSNLLVAHADSQVGSVVINEVAWAGSVDNSNDEWIELYNTTSQAVDLSGWYIEDDYTDKYTVLSGVVPAHGYFLIEDSEAAVSSVAADAVIGLSLANSGDSLILKTAAGAAIDSVNSGGGAWYAGNGTSKATMERIDPSVILDSAANFATSVSAQLGTPKGQNSVFKGVPGSVSVEFNLSNDKPLNGEVLTATLIANNALNLFAYGFDIVYDPAVLTFLSAKEDGFLSGNGQASTAFNAALENGVAGKAVVGNARLVSPASGVSGSGNLFTLEFKVVGGEGAKSSLTFGGGSFMADSLGDVLFSMTGASLEVGSNVVSGVSGLVAALGEGLYSLKLNWNAPAGGADSYIIYRKAVDGSLAQIGTSVSVAFVDNDDLTFGGDIVPGVSYQYQVRAVKNGIQSAAVSVSGVETRGVIGDNNRSGRVDGRDVENLARHYGAKFGVEAYAALADTTYDGVIDGSDLIDIGANFGTTS